MKTAGEWATEYVTRSIEGKMKGVSVDGFMAEVQADAVLHAERMLLNALLTGLGRFQGIDHLRILEAVTGDYLTARDREKKVKPTPPANTHFNHGM